MRHRSSPRIRSDFPDKVEKNLITQICDDQGKKWAHVGQFQRFGFSGARLLLIYFARKPDGVPYLVKIAEHDDAVREFNAMKALSDLVVDAVLPARRVFPATGTRSFDLSEKKWGALLYVHRSTDRPEGAADPLALRKMIYDADYSKDEVSRAIKEGFEKLKSAYAKRRTDEVPLREYFDKYFRGDAAKERIRCILGDNANTEDSTFLGAPILNPLKTLERLPDRERLCLSRVHGDLHPDNVILEHRTRTAHLIDFAWADRVREVLVDFVLLETSIRFNLFPKRMNLEEQLEVDDKLLEEDGADEIPSCRFQTPESRQSYDRLAAAVQTIRNCARSFLEADFSMERYLLTQFILLLLLASPRGPLRHFNSAHPKLLILR